MSEYTMFSKYFRVESLVVSRQNIFYFETKKDNLDYSLVINNLISYKKNYAPKVNLLLIVYSHRGHVKFMFSKKATKFDEIFSVDLTLCTKCQIGGEDFFIFCGLLRKHEL